MRGPLLRFAWYRFRTTFGLRRGGYLTLVLLVGLVGGLAMGAVAAARRTQSSFPAYLASTDPSDLIDTTAKVDPLTGVPNYDSSAVRTLAELSHIRRVRTLVGFNNVLTLGPDGNPGGGIRARGGPQALLYGSLDGEYFSQDRVSVVAGRMADPRRPGEVMMTADAVKEFGLHLGSTAHLGFYSNAEADDPAYGTSRLQPVRRVAVTLVGIVTSNDTIVRDDTDGATTFVLFTPALTRPLAISCGAYAISGLRLAGGSRDVSTVESDIVRALPDIPPNFYVSSVTVAKAERAIRPESIALGVFGGIAALAALLIAGLVIGRQLWSGSDEAGTLRALGAGSGMTMADVLLGTVGAVVLGGLVAVVVAISLSPLSPVGAARPVNPTPGVAADWTVLGFGLMVLVGGLSAVAVLLARRHAPHRVGDRRRQRATGSGLTRAAAASGLPTPAVAGIGFALEPGGGAGAVPVRSAILGAALAMTVVVTTVIFGASLDTLISRPALYGWNWDEALNSYFGGNAGIPAARAATLLDADRTVAGWTGVFYGTAQIDSLTVPVLGERPGASVAPPVLSGTALRASDEIVLGATTLAEMHRNVGDWVHVELAGPISARLRIVGTATLPTIGSSGKLHTTMGTGAILPSRLVQGQTGNGDAPNAIFVRFRAGADPRGTMGTLRRVAARLSSQANGIVSVLPVQRPAEIVNYRSMGSTPAYLGAGLAGGAVVTLGLTLIATVRRRRRDLALLKTLGFTQLQLAAAVAWQSSVCVAIGSVVGAPLGIILGRVLWDAFAHQINVVPSPSIPGLSVALIVLGALVLANVVAAVPGRIAARTPTALLLRTE